MKTIRDEIVERVEENKGVHLTDTTIWDTHHTSLGMSKNLNCYKVALALFTKNEKISTIYAEKGAKGWGQHSATGVHMFDASNMSEKDIDNANIRYTGYIYNRADFETI